jgi:ATP-dependent Lon protease
MFESLYDMAGREDEAGFVPLMGFEGDEMSDDIAIPENLPLIALKNIVMFPGVVVPIAVGRDRSLEAVKVANKGNKLLAVSTQLDPEVEEPEYEDLYSTGTVARVVKIIKMPEGSTTVFLQGVKRFELKGLTQWDPYIRANILVKEYKLPKNVMEYEAAISSIKDLGNQIIELSPHIPSEAVIMLKNIKSDTFLLNFIGSNLNAGIEEKQSLLTEDHLLQKSKLILQFMHKELQLLQLKDKLENKVKTDIQKQQREYFLNQQLKTIQDELGQNPQEEEIAKLEKIAAKKKWPKKAQDRFQKEIVKLRRINPQAPDFSIQLNFLELFVELPWEAYTQDNYDLKKVKDQLDKDHYGLEKVKNRIMEHLAVLKLKKDLKAPILCLVGPPGVGKTSLGRSIATAMGRNFVRMSLGGLHDESEIRGHRKTYIGAMPGRILQSLRKTQSGNPVFILDEIDKIGKDFRGDPSSALLEVLDPEQNNTFYDNYLEQDYDLSKILFIATANSLSTIQPALRDRMEIIEVSGYSTEEKVQIAKKYLVPDQRNNHGLKAKDAKLSDPVLVKLIQDYTRESGVRSLNRKVADLMRYVAKHVAMEEVYSPVIKVSDLETILGPRVFNSEEEIQITVPGMAIGLAWTQVGGDILFIESSLSKGKGKLTLTGNLGEVMKESAITALSYIKSHSDSLGLKAFDFDNTDIHIHVPEGAIPKDGPSAGITMLTALTSAFTGRRVKQKLAMTGEITLRGKVLPVGGIKEKILAAKRAGIHTVILCEQNKRHVEEVNSAYLEGMHFHYVGEMKEVLEVALVKK